jgi:ferric-dicitrate binding protein FerR (iron transport regulator)
MTETELTRWEKAQANHKEAVRLLEDAKAAFARGEVPQKRVDELTRLKEIATEDYLRCEKEHRSGFTDY